jgi:hypothetical protein
MSARETLEAMPRSVRIHERASEYVQIECSSRMHSERYIRTILLLDSRRGLWGSQDRSRCTAMCCLVAQVHSYCTSSYSLVGWRMQNCSRCRWSSKSPWTGIDHILHVVSQAPQASRGGNTHSVPSCFPYFGPSSMLAVCHSAVP